MKNVIKSLIVMCVISLMSCNVTNKISTTKFEDCIDYLGTYDTARLIPTHFLRGNTTIVCFEDDSAVVIWGKKCEFVKSEPLYAKAVWFYSPGFGGGRWKYFLMNEDESIKYSLLDP